MKKILSGISAGIMVAIGCSVYLACENKYVGACLFSVALLTVCLKQYSLYTGKIGTIVENHKKEDFSVLLLGLLGNVIGMIVLGFAISYALPSISDTAKIVVESKLSEQNFLQTLIRAILCGVLMYVAVSTYKENKTIVGILFTIPAFILAGFEHSIADLGYFAIANEISLKAFGFFWTVILGNTIGSCILPLLKLTKNKTKEQSTIEQSNDTDKNNVVEN